MKRYAAKLLFQFRVLRSKRRLCEERIILLQSGSAGHALALAKRRGRESQHTYTNGLGEPVHFEFVGVVELLHLGPECEADEVWYELKERLLPMERKARHLSAESALAAIRNETGLKSTRRRVSPPSR
jgi:hypothetical protein